MMIGRLIFSSSIFSTHMKKYYKFQNIVLDSFRKCMHVDKDNRNDAACSIKIRWWQ